MQTFVADVSVSDDDGLDHGEGWLEFSWTDALYGVEGLAIDLDGHCSRRMPIRSGQGPPTFVELGRNYLKLRFSAALAQKLELEEEILIQFEVGEDDFKQLERTIDYFNGRD